MRAGACAVVCCATFAAVSVIAGCAPQQDGSHAEQVSDLLTKGLNAQSAGNPALASTYYYDVLEQDPRNVLAYFNLGTIAHAQENYVAAEDNFRVVLSIDPEFALARSSLENARAARAER